MEIVAVEIVDTTLEFVRERCGQHWALREIGGTTFVVCQHWGRTTRVFCRSLEGVSSPCEWS